MHPIRFIVMVVLVLAALAAAPDAHADEIRAVATRSKLNVRSTPSVTAPVIVQLRPGTEIVCTSDDGSWTTVTLSDGRRGYAASRYLEYRRPYHRTPQQPAAAERDSGEMSPTVMILILIVVSWLLGYIIMSTEPDSAVVRAIGIFFICSFFGAVAGLLCWWVFDSFWGPYLTVAAGFGLVRIIRDYTDDDTPSDCGPVMYSDEWNHGGGSSSSRSYSSSPRPRSSYESREREQREEREREEQSRQNREYFSRYADDAYGNYERYKDMAREAESEADTEERYADDYEWRAREFNDSSYASRASECRRNASNLRRKASQYESEADRYYRDYQSYQDRARTS